MEPQDHIATLCVASTLGLAATGLALGVPTENDNTTSVTPGKRKWPGATSSRSQTTPLLTPSSRRIVSQPTSSTLPITQDKPEHHRSTSLFRRQSKRDIRPTTANESDVTGSRGSSLNRSGLFRPRSADTRSTSERRDPSASSSWLKRISMVSSQRASSPSAHSSQADYSMQSTTSVTPAENNQTLPNKLVKRSTSHRALSHDQARGTFLRRPATSHQRSATVHEWVPHETSYSTPATPFLTSESSPIWRPFFERGHPRKRHTTANLRESLGLRTVSTSNVQQPTLILGSQVEAIELPNDQTEKTSEPNAEARRVLTGRQKLKRSLSSIQRTSRRRHFTDPTVKVTTEAVNGTFSSTTTHSPLSPMLQTSPFDVDLPSSSPTFSSSPPLLPVRHRFSFRKRQSTAPSDPTTASSDNDTRVFTDDDSMDFQSDTAYDSLTTRATASSHSALRTPNLETVFNDPQIRHNDGTDATLAKLVQKATLTDGADIRNQHRQGEQLFGMGITEIEEENDRMDIVHEPGSNRTPIKSTTFPDEEYNVTPMPHRLQYFGNPLKSSPPVLGTAAVNRDIATPEFVMRRMDIEDNNDEIDWSPKSDTRGHKSTSTLRQDAFGNDYAELSSPDLPFNQPYPTFVDEEDSESYKRLSSLFDWSEHQKFASDGHGTMQARPKTVHGKQAHDATRSRSSGRKGAPPMHLRSQSVPNNRDTSIEQAPHSQSKFGTWGLGHKGVSEEWSDDFEFDDVEDETSYIEPAALKSSNRSTLRGVKVPQAIMERQASVHIQFGQVQEFMLLVEELKNLRARGMALQLLETHSKQLWADAESIIDLATINNEDETIPRPGSPTSSDVFQDDSPLVSKHTREDHKRSSTVFRSASSPATPPTGRPRGESLAQAKNLLQSIHQNRSGINSSPMDFDDQPQKKLPFDTQDLKDLVVRSGVITRALKEIVRKAEGLSVSPNKTPPKPREPAFSQIFNAPDSSPCPPFRKPGLPKSKSANSYLLSTYGSNNGTTSPSPTRTALML